MDIRNAIHSTLTRIVTLVVVASGVAACATTGPTSDSDLAAASDLVQLLEDEGVNLFPGGIARDLQFSTVGQAYDVGRGGALHIYEYDRAQQASLDAMGADGRVASGAAVFQSGNLIAVYLGNNLSVRSALSKLMGPQLY